jgi:hypothetical protein
MPPPSKARSRAPVNTSWWRTVTEDGRMISRPRTTMLPRDSSRRLACGSNMSWPPGMTATPPTSASTSRKTGRVTTAVSPGPGTPRDQERRSLQRLQPAGTRLAGGAVDVGAARGGGAGTVVVVAPPPVSSQGRPR